MTTTKRKKGETQKQLDKAEARRSWWGVFKGWFS